MANLLRRGRRRGDVGGEDPPPAPAPEVTGTGPHGEGTAGEPTGSVPADQAGSGGPSHREPSGQREEPPVPAAPAAQASTDRMQGAAEADPLIPFDPAPAPPPAPRSSGGLLTRALGNPGEQSADERERVAAMEFEQAISPVIELMRASVPGATTPEDAARILSENQPEIPPDPDGGAYIYGDAYQADARVYYRLLRRDYEKNPRPSQKPKVSHHLHGVYGKLTGTKGW